jgi:hypothetical protein
VAMVAGADDFRLAGDGDDGFRLRGRSAARPPRWIKPETALRLRPSRVPMRPGGARGEHFARDRDLAGTPDIAGRGPWGHPIRIRAEDPRRQAAPGNRARQAGHRDAVGLVRQDRDPAAGGASPRPIYYVTGRPIWRPAATMHPRAPTAVQREARR